MADTITVPIAVSSDTAMDKALALAETYLKPEVAADLQKRLKTFHLRSASLEFDATAPGLGEVRVNLGVTVTGEG